jgi:hypothetical protein
MRVSKPVVAAWVWFGYCFGLCVGTWAVVALTTPAAVLGQIPPPGPTPQQKYASYKTEAEKSALKCSTAKGTAEIKRARAQFNVADYFRLKQHFLDVWTVSGHQLPSQAFFNALLNYEVAMTGHLEDGEGVALTTYGAGYLGGEHHRAAGVSDFNTGVGYAAQNPPNWSYATSYMTYAKDWYDSGTTCYDASGYPFVLAGDTARTAMFLILQYAQTLDPGFTWQVPN